MPISRIYSDLLDMAQREYSEIVVSGRILHFPTGDPHKVRLEIVDSSFLDIFLSASGRYSYHWERRPAGIEAIFRHDNAPHKPWRAISTFPKHFHNGSEDNVTESHISDVPITAVSQILEFIRSALLHATQV